MNNDLISRSELKRKLHSFFDGKTIVEPAYILRDVFYYIDNAPKVSLQDIYQEGHYDGHLEGYTKAINEERSQGEWIILDRNDRFKIGYYKCNLCGYKYPVPDELSKNFCPHCGANMEGGAENG